MPEGQSLCHNTGMKEPALLYLIVGLLGAGKTTKARQLEVEASALRFTRDEWMKMLFGTNDPATRDILECRLIWIALRAFQLHTNVILDFGFWSKDDRSGLRWVARQIGAKSQVIYLPIDPERNGSASKTAFPLFTVLFISIRNVSAFSMRSPPAKCLTMV
ncbi:MAG: AAA family ATPase [Ktedonobacteraceae bacterium]|nr:AAA family ATPase [Ktedonobacteraceae bacterium]